MTSSVAMNARALRIAVALATVGVLAMDASERLDAQGERSPIRRAHGASISDLQVVHVQGNVYALFGAGPNITMSVGSQGILMVNTGPAGMEEQILEVIKKLGTGIDPVREAPPVPIRFIVNTSARPDDTGGNEKIQAAAEFIRGGEHILAHEKVLARMSEPPKGQTTPPRPPDAWPTDTFRGEQMKLGRFFNGEGVQLLHVPAAHTDGDSLVWFRYSDVIATGNIFSTTGWPVIDLERGGSFQGVIDGLNLILKTGLSDFRTEGGTVVVPGHGRIGDLADVGFYRDMLTIVRDRIQDGLKRGLTVEQVKAEKPTLGWESRYGSKTGPWTTDMFIEAAYKSLSESKTHAPKR